VNPVKVTVGSIDLSASHTVKQIVEVIDQAHKESRLEQLLNKYHSSRTNRVLVFALYKKVCCFLLLLFVCCFQLTLPPNIEMKTGSITLGELFEPERLEGCVDSRRQKPARQDPGAGGFQEGNSSSFGCH